MFTQELSYLISLMDSSQVQQHIYWLLVCYKQTVNRLISSQIENRKANINTNEIKDKILD